MVKELVEDIKSRYLVDIEESPVEGRSQFIEIAEKVNPLKRLTLQFLDGDLYSVMFINNEFFEISSEDLSLVLWNILKGKYVVKKSLFRKPSITTPGPHNKLILPERLHNQSLTTDDIKLYRVLPAAFSLK